jgi:hypothetical protein
MHAMKSKKRRVGRARGHLTIRVSEVEQTLLRERAQAEGVSVSVLLRSAGLGLSPRRATPEASLVARHDRVLKDGVRQLGFTTPRLIAQRLLEIHNLRHRDAVATCPVCGAFWQLLIGASAEGTSGGSHGDER